MAEERGCALTRRRPLGIGGVALAALAGDSPELDKHTPVADATERTCAVDPIDDVLFVRYHGGGAKRIRSFPLDAAAEGGFSGWRADIAQPSPGDVVFQGDASCDQYLYLFDGESYDASPTLNSRVTCVDMNSGEIVLGPLLTKAGESLAFGEPEGLAGPRTAGGEPRLLLGFASGEAGERRGNLF